MKILNEEQMKLKIEKYKKRKQKRKELEDKGYIPPIIPDGFTKSGCTKATSGENYGKSEGVVCNSSNGNSSGDSVGASGGGTGYYIDNGYIPLALYRNVGEGGFYTYANFDRPVIYYDEGTSNEITFDEVKFISIRIVSGTTTSSNYLTQYTAGTALYEDGTDGDVATNVDYRQFPFEYTTGTLSSGTYSIIMKYDLGSSTDPTWYINGWYRWSNASSLSLLTSPAGSYSQSNNEFTFSSYATSSCRVFEFNRPSFTPYSSYRADEVHNILYNCALRNQEYDVYDGQANPTTIDFDVLTMWDVGTYEVKVSYDSGHPAGTRTRLSDAVNSWISLMNSTIGGSGVSFTRNDSASSPDMLIESKSTAQMGDFGGYWQTSVDGFGYIYYAYIRINYEVNYVNNQIEYVVTEELTQACGCGGDLVSRSDIINTDFNYWQKGDNYSSGAYFSSIDTQIQELLYLEDLYLYVGFGSDVVAIALNPFNGYMSTTGTTVNMYNFAESTTYNYRIWQAKTDDSFSIIPSYSSTFTTGGYPNTPSAPVAGTPPRIDGGLNISWSSTTDCDKYDLNYRNYAETQSSFNIVATTKQLTGLEYGVSYYISIRGVSDGHEPPSSYSGESTLTTAPKMPTKVAYSDTSSIAIDFSGFSGNWTTVVVAYSTDTSYSSSVTINNPTVTANITSLPDDTLYNFKVSIYYTVSAVDIYAVDGSGNTDYLYFTKSTTPIRPSNWAWTTSIVSGGNIHSISGKKLYLMPYTEWNNFTTRINEFRAYKDLSAYSFTTVASDGDFTLTIINQALTAIRAMSAYFTGGNTVPSNRVAGDNIFTASYFTNMRDSLNSIT